MSRLAPLSALHTFVEVARAGSMKKAADVLCVSPGAVSQQIKSLEDRLNKRLFERSHREIKLSDAGTQLFDQLSNEFAGIQSAWDSASTSEIRIARLVISTTISFASSWLVPHLGSFSEQWPNIEVSVETSPRLVDLRRDYVDVAIRHGLGAYPQHVSTKLWAPAMLAVCSPTLLQGQPAIERPSDCLRYPLLQDADRADWTLWLRAQGIEDARSRRGTSYSDDGLLIRAAIACQGIALVQDVHAKNELETGALVSPLRAPNTSDFAYYLVSSDERATEWKIVAFTKWIQSEASAMQVFQSETGTAVTTPYPTRKENSKNSLLAMSDN
jgi:LysR family glycine cleavage system transcriptional activator